MIVAGLLMASMATAQQAEIDGYNVEWNTPSENSAGSMPLGNGELGANLWVEKNGDLLFYLSRTDAISEANRLMKMGRIRVSLSPNPFQEGKPFSQQLVLKDGRPIFFGSMITEGIVALIWAAAATYFYHNNGMGENNAAVVVDSITKEWLGTVGGVLAVLGVIAAPITSGDTAFRSARLIVADFLHLEQRSISKRLMICVPLFLVAIALLLYSQKDKDGFDMIWRYFAWSNQTLAVFTLWALTVYLVISKKPYIVTLIPALFMTAVCSTYIFVAPAGLGMENGISQIIGFAITIVVLAFFLVWKKKSSKI